MPIIRVGSVLPVIVLVLELLGRRLNLGIDPLAAGRHFGHFFNDGGVINGLVRIFAPREHSVVGRKAGGNGDDVFIFKSLVYDLARVDFVLVHFICIEGTRTGDIAIEIVGVRCAVGGDSTLSLRKRRGVS